MKKMKMPKDFTANLVLEKWAYEKNITKDKMTQF